MAGATEMPFDMTSLKEQTTCSSCQQQYNNPRTLACLHSYCLACLERAVAKDDGGSGGLTVWCSECRRPIPVVEGDGTLEALPKAFYLSRQVQLYQFLLKVTGRAEVRCEKCSTTKTSARAASYCNDCAKFVCDLCVQIHRSWAEFQRHRVVTLGELKDSFRADGPPSTAPVELLRCSKHDKQCTMFCESCAEQICHECIVKLHRDHQYNLLEEAAAKRKALTRERLETIQGLPPLLQQSIATLDALSQGLAGKARAVSTAVDARFDRLEHLLANRRKALLQDVADTVQGKIRILQEQKESLVQNKRGITACVDFVGRTVQDPHDSEFLLLEQRMADKIAGLKKEFAGLELIPAEEPDVFYHAAAACGLDMGDDVIARVAGSVSDGSLLQAGLENAQSFAVNELVTFYIALSPSYYKIRDKPSEQLRADIQSLRDGSVCAATVAVSSSGFAKLQCSFAERGRYSINVRISNHHVSGSPYQFFIRAPLAHSHQPIRSIAKLACPKGVAVNASNQLIVSEETAHAVTVYGKKSKVVLKTGAMGTSEGSFNGPTGVAADVSGGFIYVADTKNNRVVKLTSAEGAFAGQFDGEKAACGRLSAPTGLKLAPDGRLFVVDRGNSRVIVLNSKMELDASLGEKSLSGPHLQDPWDVAFDKQGFIYVTDMKQHCVLIFSGTGDYRGKLGSQGNQKARLSRPAGIAIDRFGRIFISEFGNNRISIFHVFSEFLDCIGAGTILVAPTGIAVDDDGYIYVCSSDSVHVF